MFARIPLASRAKLFRFHGEFKEILSEIRLTNPPFLHLNPLLKDPGSAPAHLHADWWTGLLPHYFLGKSCILVSPCLLYCGSLL